MGTPAPVSPVAQRLDVTITDGTSISSAISLKGRLPVLLIVPASWTTAAMTFQVCSTIDGTFVDLYNTSGSELSASVASSRAVALNPVDWWGVHFVKFRSGTSGTPVNQSGDITFEVMCARSS